jgi:hypothetical protein
MHLGGDMIMNGHQMEDPGKLLLADCLSIEFDIFGTVSEADGRDIVDLLRGKIFYILL